MLKDRQVEAYLLHPRLAHTPLSDHLQQKVDLLGKLIVRVHLPDSKSAKTLSISRTFCFLQAILM